MRYQRFLLVLEILEILLVDVLLLVGVLLLIQAFSSLNVLLL